MSRPGRTAAVLFALAILIAGCSTAPRMITGKPERSAGPDAALVVFLRPNPLAFGGAEFSLWDSRQFIGFIDPMSSLSYHATPGEHLFLAGAENWAVIRGKVAAGKTYYLWIDPRMGEAGPCVNMTVLDPEDERIPEWLERARPVMLADPATAGAVEKKHRARVAEAISDMKSGRMIVRTLLPFQGR